MSDPLLLSPYGRPEAFVVAGKTRGVHHLTPQPGGLFGYRAQLSGPGPLPSARLCGAATAALQPLPQYGPPDRAAPRELPMALVPRSTGHGFWSAVLHKQGLLHVVDNLGGAGLDLRLDADPSGGTVQTHLVAGPTRRADALALACCDLGRRWVRALDEVVQDGTTFPDARLAFDAVNPDEPVPERLDRMTQLVAAQAHWLTAEVARRQDHLEARLRLHEGGLDLAGTLRLAWPDAAVTHVDLSLEAALPDTDGGRAHIQRQTTWNRWLFWEHEVNDPTLDDALLLRGDEAATLHWTRRLGPRLLVLCRHDLELFIDPDRMALRLEQVPAISPELGPALDEVLYLWRQIALERGGLAAP